MNSTWVEALALIISPVSITALVFYFGRTAVTQFLARNLEAHKAQLSSASEREIESLKAELLLAAHEHDVVFERLHSERAEVIKNLYDKVRTLSKSAKRYAGRQDVTTAEDHDANRKAVEAAATDLNQAMLDGRIFLPEELCARIQKGMDDVVGYATNIAGEWFPFPKKTPEERFAAVLENKEKLESAAWQMETELATEFRKLLGVR